MLKKQHKTLMAVGLLVMIAAWFSWTILLAESDVPPEPPTADGAY